MIGIHISDGSPRDREELQEVIAKALDDYGVRVTVVAGNGGYEYNYQKPKARRAAGFAIGDVAITVDE